MAPQVVVSDSAADAGLVCRQNIRQARTINASTVKARNCNLFVCLLSRFTTPAMALT